MAYLWRTIEIAVVACTVGLHFYSIHLFEKHFTTGKSISDSLYTIRINNHGTHRFITEAQNAEYELTHSLSIVAFILMFIVCFLRAKKSGQ